MKLNEITEVGFYRAVKDNRPDYIFEVIENTDKEWLKEAPEQKFLIDEWLFDYIDNDDRVHYGTAGNLVYVQNADNIEVTKITNKKYKITGGCGEYLIEDKLTYKEKINKINELCKEYRHNKPRLLCDLDTFVERVEELTESEATNDRN